MASTELSFADEAQAKESINDVRSNESATNWVLFTYSEKSKNKIELVGKGTGGIEELKAHLNDSKMFYGLVRVQDVIDQSVTIKFVFIVWCGEHVPFLQKAKMTTHKGSISLLVGQYHNDINASHLDELNDNVIMGKVSDASGTAYHVKESSTHPTPAPSSTTTSSTTTTTTTTTSSSGYKRGGVSSSSSSNPTTKQPGVPQQASNVHFLDEDSLRAAIRAVRADNDETDWLLIGYEGTGNSKELKLIAKGADGLEELLGHFVEDQVLYALYRTTDTIDNTVAVKFVFIIWVGEKVAVTRKARITTHKGEITAFIGQYHVDLNCSNLHEVNDDIIRDLVQRAGGTAVHVK